MVPPARDSGTWRVAPASDTSSAWLPSVSSRRRGVLPRSCRRSATSAPAGVDSTDSVAAPARPRRCCASTAPDRRRGRAAARRRVRRPSTAACARRGRRRSRRESIRRGRPGPETEREPTQRASWTRTPGRAGRRRVAAARGTAAQAPPASVHRLRAARRHARERRRGPGRSGAARRATGRVRIALRGRADDGLVRFVGGAVAGEHLARHTRGECPPSGGADQGRLRARGAMQRRYRYRRRASHRGRKRRRDQNPRADAGVRVSSCEGAAGETGARNADAGGSGSPRGPGAAR